MRKILLLLGICSLLVLTGCAHQNIREIREGHWTVAIPKTWQDVAPSGDRWQKAFQGDGVRLEIAGHLNDQSIARGALGDLNFPALTQLPDFKSLSIEDLKVSGQAQEVVIQRYTFTDGGQPRAGAWVVGTQWPNPESAAISISTESGELDESLLNQLLQSLKWHKTS